MHLDLVYHPRELAGRDLSNVCCVVLDVLRATTTMATAIGNGAEAIYVFAELEEARSAHTRWPGARKLAGERGCLPPPGFDLGNSPCDFTRERVAGATIFMSTTNGTRAVHACRTASRTLVASLVNASATVAGLIRLNRDVVFVCAGVDGAPGGEDIDAAATIADRIMRSGRPVSASQSIQDEIVKCSWLTNRFNGVERLRASPGGRNLCAAGLERDIDSAACLDCLDCVCAVVYTETDAIVTRLD